MKIILVSVLALALMLVFAACGASEAPLPSSQEAATPPASSKQPQSGLPKASGEEQPAEPEALEDPDGAMIDAHSDVQGDMETHNSWYDEENELLLSYPNVFEPIGERDADGYMRFKSLQTEGVELVYWVTPNTYGYTPSEFIVSASYNDMLELEGNAVIGRFDDLYQETGEVVPTAYYWVVDTQRIVNVAIYCDTPEYRDVIYEDLKNAAVFIESIAGIDVKGYTADDVTLSFNENYNIAGDGDLGWLVFTDEDEYFIMLGERSMWGEYTTDGRRLRLELPDAPEAELTLYMMDDYMLSDEEESTGLFFMREGGELPEFTDTSEYLYQDGIYLYEDESEFVKLSFYELESYVSFERESEDVFDDGSYTLDGSDIHIELSGGETMTVRVVNKYMLALEDGTVLTMSESLFDYG